MKIEYANVPKRWDGDGYCDAYMDGWNEAVDALYWQPIATAPKDGTYISMWSNHHGFVREASYSPGGEGFYAYFYDSVCEVWDQRKVTDATHWMHIPGNPND